MQCLATLLVVAVGEDSLVVMQPPVSTSERSALLVWIPGGKVPNTVYAPMLQKVQQALSGTVDLWVSIASCPDSGTTGGLCIPSFGDANVTAALDAGRKASGVDAPEQTWLGGHSLGGAAADYYCTHDEGKAAIRGGCILMGDYIFEGPQGMLNYPLPVLSLLGELNFGSARPMKMAPYFAVADAAGPEQLLRTPIVVVKGIDHSDMCEGFPVEGDLHSSLSPEEATDAIASLTSDFMISQIFPAEAEGRMRPYLDFTREYMAPMNAALDLDLYSAGWCEKLQLMLAGPFADRVDVSGRYYNTSVEWPAPSAKYSRVKQGVVEITVTSRNAYESDSVWPPADPWPFMSSGSLGATAAPPPVVRATPTSQGCRMISQSKISELLGYKGPPESANFCETANKAAWQWAQDNALKRTLDRYASAQPCNDCSSGAQMVFMADTDGGDTFEKFANMTLGYDVTDETVVVQSPAFMSGEEHSCMLLSPSRAMDFLVLDAYQANCYPPPAQLFAVV